MSLTNYGAKNLADALFSKNGAFGNLGTPPGGAGGLWMALATAVADEDAGSFTEATGTGYARVQVAPGSWDPATTANPAVITNNAQISMGTAGAGGWSGGANMTHAVLMDANTAGNAVAIGALGTPKPVAENDPVTFEPGAVTFTLT